MIELFVLFNRNLRGLHLCVICFRRNIFGVLLLEWSVGVWLFPFESDPDPSGSSSFAARELMPLGLCLRGIW